MFVATILVTYITILTVPDLSLQSYIRVTMTFVLCFNAGLVKKN